MNEPTAAALAYGLDKRKEGIVAVYDLGGGTFDISILRLHEGIFEVLATNGDTHLGGDDIDHLLMRIALDEIRNEWGEDIAADSIAVQTAAPRGDSGQGRAVLRARERSFGWITTASSTRASSRSTCSTEVIQPIVDKTLGPCRACIKDAGVTVEQIDEVVLVGGSTRIPLVRSRGGAAVPREAAHGAQSG